MSMQDVAQLEEALSRPSEADIDFMSRLGGDVMVLGAGGKMGPSLAKLARRATVEAGVSREVFAVSRFSSQPARDDLDAAGVRTLSCDLMKPGALDSLPDCANVLYLAGRKFGSSGRPDLTWATNAVLPAWVAQRFKGSRIVAFSTGNVYPFSPVSDSSNPRSSIETDEPGPVGEYAQSCLARERVFEYFSREQRYTVRTVPSELCRGPALRRSRRHCAKGEGESGRGSHRSRVQRNLAARRKFVCAACA